MDQEMPLSGVEQGRLQRAFYRYELYGHLLGSDLEYCGEKLWEHPCDSHFFLRLYNTWEQHEMACVDNYLRSRLDSVFDKVEHAFVGIEISLPHVEDEGLVDRFSKPRREAILAAKRTIHSRYLDYMLSMSLPFLHSTLELGDEEQQRKFSSHIHYDSQKRSFTNALEEQTIDNRNGDRDKIMNYLSHKEDGLPTTFGDTIETANEGWLWTNCFEDELASPEVRHAILTVGLVFWDSYRLRVHEAAYLNPNQIYKRCEENGSGLPPDTLDAMYRRFETSLTVDSRSS
ncbi:hypothetical protein MMC28_007581 [Mycoblastus sanguinarius]|nr:hypothetical protein [Mycoblastus sanguinarius]